MYVDFVRFLKIKLPKAKNYQFGFKFTKNGHSCEIYTNNEQIYENWSNILSLKMIQTTFHEDFEVTKIIGKGSFANVLILNSFKK